MLKKMAITKNVKIFTLLTVSFAAKSWACSDPEAYTVLATDDQDHEAGVFVTFSNESTVKQILRAILGTDKKMKYEQSLMILPKAAVAGGLQTVYCFDRKKRISDFMPAKDIEGFRAVITIEVRTNPLYLGHIAQKQAQRDYLFALAVMAEELDRIAGK